MRIRFHGGVRMVSRKLKCACGEVFESSSPNAKRCLSCSMIFKRMYNKYVKSTKSSQIAMKLATEEYDSRLHDGTLTSIEKHKPFVRCKYCGRPTKRDFCPNCVSEGFDQVYLITGRSNGWNRVQTTKVKITDGWRGQPRAGGRSQPLALMF